MVHYVEFHQLIVVLLSACSAFFLAVFDFKFLPSFSGVLLVFFMKKILGLSLWYLLLRIISNLVILWWQYYCLQSAFFLYGLIYMVLLGIIYLNTSFLFFLLSMFSLCGLVWSLLCFFPCLYFFDRKIKVSLPFCILLNYKIYS